MLDQITKCRGCRSSKITEVLPLQSIPLGAQFSREPNQELVYPIGLTLCEKCSLVQLTQEYERRFFDEHREVFSLMLSRKPTQARHSLFRHLTASESKVQHRLEQFRDNPEVDIPEYLRSPGG